MNSLNKEHIEIFREYFLSQNEDVRRNIRNILPGVLLKYLSIIETGFLQKANIENIASQIEATHLISDLRQLQTDYYSSLNQKFEMEIAFAIKATERDAFKKKFSAIDQEDEFQIPETEIKSAIKEVERESIKRNFKQIDKQEEPVSKTPVFSINRFVKYAAAAAIIGFVFLGGYLLLNPANRSEKTSIAKKGEKKDSVKTDLAANIPEIPEQQNEKQILTSESFGFAKDHPQKLIVITQNIGAYIDTLRTFYYEELQGRYGTAGNGPVAKAISQKLDSLSGLINTYTYDVSNRKAIVKLSDKQVIDKVISIDPQRELKLFIKIGKSYFQLNPTQAPLKLILVNDKATIEELEKIIFQNS